MNNIGAMYIYILPLLISLLCSVLTYTFYGERTLLLKWILRGPFFGYINCMYLIVALMLSAGYITIIVGRLLIANYL